MIHPVSIDVLEYTGGMLHIDGSVSRELAVRTGQNTQALAGRMQTERVSGRREQTVQALAGRMQTERVSGRRERTVQASAGRMQTERTSGGKTEAMDSAAVAVRLNGERIPVRFTGRYAQVVVEKEVFPDRSAFTVEIPAEKLQKENMLEFVTTAGTDRVLPILSTNYQARLHSNLQQGWWSFRIDGAEEVYMAMLQKRAEREGVPGRTKDAACVPGTDNKAGLPDSLRIRRTGRMGRFMQELRFLKEILCAKNGSKQMFVMRCLYWLAYPVYHKKNIWMTFDKLYKGGDCGEYFYRYMCSRKEAGIIPAYVIKSNAPDYGRLKEDGFTPLVYRSRRQRLSYLYSAMVFGTHSGVNSFCGFNNWEIRFVQDRLRCVNTCIQHGLSVQDLSADSNRAVNNNKRYYCASRREIENLSKPVYDYAPEALRLTGIPRYDGLVNDDKKQILITPTWRSYLAVQSVMGEARGYNPEFCSTEYYRIFQSLLENRKLTGTAERCGYRIIYLLHPVISAQKKDFRRPEGVQILTALDTDYEEVLTQSSLMVTDYSGVQFDFAYMRKPVVYFHPQELPPHYGDGGFCYETQGFGEICTELSGLVDMLCEYMENGCALKDFYRARQDDFFAYGDRENCRRIFEDALEYQRISG